MDNDQFNQLMSYVMLIALNSTQLLFQQSHQRPLSESEVGACQDYLLHHARKLQEVLGKKDEWPQVPPFGRPDG